MSDPRDPNHPDFDLSKEFDRLIAEGGSYRHEVELESRYNCNRDMHKWKWYVGFHTERFWFCELCDLKDRCTRFPPSRS